MNLCCVEDVQRAGPVEGHVIGDIDERGNRAQADGAQAALHPVRRRAVLHAAHEAQSESWAEILRRREIDGNGARAFARDSWHGGRLHRAETGGGEVGGDARHAQRIGPIGGDADFDDRVGQARIVGKRRADRGVVRQVDDAVMGVGQFQFPFRTHHAAGFDAPDVADAERRVDAGHVGAGGGKGTDQALSGIRRTAHDLHRITGSGIDGQHLQLIGIRMLFGGDHLGDDERREMLARVHGLDLKADHGERVADGVEGCVGLEMIAQPGEGEFHLRFSKHQTRDKQTFPFWVVQSIPDDQPLRLPHLIVHGRNPAQCCLVLAG